MPQFEKVSSRYGAPMGRASFGTPENCEDRSVRLFRVNLDSGGYDDGGAYWGAGLLFCATDGADYRQFTRAGSRLSAMCDLDIPRNKLKMPPHAEYVKLYTLEQAGCISAGGVLLRQRLNTLGF